MAVSRSLDGFAFPVRHSPGARERALDVARRVERASEWLAGRLGCTARIRVSVADAADWDTVATTSTYGTPQGSGDHVRFAADDGWFGAALYAEIAPHVGAATTARLRGTYGEPPALRPYFDLVGVHETTHLFQDQAWPDAPGMWISELHANLAMVGFAHEVEPESLPALRALTSTVDELPARATPVRELADMAESSAHGAANFAWFHFGLTRAAEELWTCFGAAALREVFEHVRDGGGADHPVLAHVATRWGQSASGPASSGMAASSVRETTPNLG